MRGEVAIGDYLSTREDEGEVIVEVGELRIVLELLPNLSLVSGRGMGNLLLEEAADLLEPLLLRLPRRTRRHRYPTPAKRGSGFWGLRERGRRKRGVLELVGAAEREREPERERHRFLSETQRHLIVA